MNLSQIRHEAAQRLREDGDQFRKSVLIHSAVTVGISLLLMLIIYLSQNIAPEGGLSNLGTQTLLETGQTLLQFINMIAVPFWNAGLIFCTIKLIRKQDQSAFALTEGFRRWGPIAGSLLFRALIYFGLSFACSFASSIPISMLPFPPSILEELTAFMEAPTFPLSPGVQIFFILYFVLYMASICIFLIPRVYAHRLTIYQIMDNEPCSGLQAVLQSRILMKGYRRKLLLLDLSFWWFYLLELLAGLLSMGDLLLEAAGIVLPIPAEVAAWLFPIAALVAQLVLYCTAKPMLAATYGAFYQNILDESQKEPEPSEPKPMPWKY